jgi:N-methylhydantoinase A
MLGCFLARELGIPRVMIPHRPGIVSALGGLIADIKGDFVQTVYQSAEPASLPTLRDALGRLKADATHWLRQDQKYEGAAIETLSADMRYQGQSFEIEVPLQESWLTDGAMQDITAAFHRQHLSVYDFNDEANAVQIVNLRLVIAGASPRPRDVAAELPESRQAAPDRYVRDWLDGAWTEAPLFRREALRPGDSFEGPAVVVQDDTTSCIPPGFSASVDARFNLILDGAQEA